MQSLIDFLLNYKHWFLFLLLEIISLFGLFSGDGFQRNVYLTTANGVVGAAYSAVSRFTSYVHLQDVNMELEQENQVLRRKLVQMRRKMEAAGADSLDLRGVGTEYSIVNAQVVNSTLHKANNLLTINRGSADGIKPEMGVVCSRGVVGVVFLVSRHYSVVMPLINERSKVSCRLRHSDYFGTLEWKRGRSDIAYVTGIPLHARFSDKELIETNGYSDIFPPGIPVGYVMSKENSADGMSYLLKVGLAANFNTLRQVSVITDYVHAERRTLENKADSLSI